jgi:hypothetical protein
MRGLLYGIGDGDPSTFARSRALVAAVALAASYLPARRAAHVDPTDAMAADYDQSARSGTARDACYRLMITTDRGGVSSLGSDGCADGGRAPTACRRRRTHSGGARCQRERHGPATVARLARERVWRACPTVEVAGQRNRDAAGAVRMNWTMRSVSRIADAIGGDAVADHDAARPRASCAVSPVLSSRPAMRSAMPAAVASVLAVALRRNPSVRRAGCDRGERSGARREHVTQTPRCSGERALANQLHHPTLGRRIDHNGLAQLVNERRERVRRRHAVKHDSPPEGSHAVVRTTASRAS